MLPVGATLQMGKYRVEKCLASGGFGNTYVVMNTKFDERMAMKEFFMRGVSERNDHNTVTVSNSDNRLCFNGQCEKFNKEARRLRKLHNEHIVQVHDLFDENETSYYVMDYVDGESLSQRLKRTGKPLSEAEALDVFNQILDALDSVHSQGIWHLDLKPSNIMVDVNGVVKVIDFGASKQMSADDGYTTTNTMCYTPGYAPPEQIDQKMELIGPWTDLYALGAMLYKLLTGKQPPAVSELDDKDSFIYPDGVSERTRQLVQWMMTLRRAGRPQSVQQVKDFLAGKVEAPVKQPSTASASFDESTVLGGAEEPQQSKKAKKSQISQNSQDSRKSQTSQSSQKVLDSQSSNDVQDPLLSIKSDKKLWWKSGKVLGIGIAAVALLCGVIWFAMRGDDAQSYYEQGKKLEEQGDSVTAVQYYQKAADLGNAEAQYSLGLCYYKGKGVEKDFKQAVLWYRKSADQGNAEAQNHLGYCYENGYGVTKDLEQAVSWYRKAANQDLVDAQFNLGVCYHNGEGVTKDQKQAVEWLRKAAEQGLAEAQTNLGNCYSEGEGVTKDLKQAVEWYRKAADQGLAGAQLNLGNCYSEGEGVAKDMKQAVYWYRKAAEQGDADAQYCLGICYENGEGVTKDLKQAVEWYRKAAEQGDADAQYCLGICYGFGTGVTKDLKQAVYWYRKAAEQGNANAQYNLGVCYENGEGVPKDQKQAVAWYRKAAAQGDTDAKQALQQLTR